MTEKDSPSQQMPSSRELVRGKPAFIANCVRSALQGEAGNTNLDELHQKIIALLTRQDAELLTSYEVDCIRAAANAAMDQCMEAAHAAHLKAYWEIELLRLYALHQAIKGKTDIFPTDPEAPDQGLALEIFRTSLPEILTLIREFGKIHHPEPEKLPADFIPNLILQRQDRLEQARLRARFEEACKSGTGKLVAPLFTNAQVGIFFVEPDLIGVFDPEEKDDGPGYSKKILAGVHPREGSSFFRTQHKVWLPCVDQSGQTCLTVHHRILGFCDDLTCWPQSTITEQGVEHGEEYFIIETNRDFQFVGSLCGADHHSYDKPTIHDVDGRRVCLIAGDEYNHELRIVGLGFGCGSSQTVDIRSIIGGSQHAISTLSQGGSIEVSDDYQRCYGRQKLHGMSQYGNPISVPWEPRVRFSDKISLTKLVRWWSEASIRLNQEIVRANRRAQRKK